MLNIDYNPFSQSFLKARNSIDVEREVQIIKTLKVNHLKN